MSKKILFIVIAVLLIGGIYGVYKGFIQEKEPDFVTREVYRGLITQEVSETGVVKASEEINLAFKSVGKIGNIYVKTGENVEKEQALAKLDTTQLVIQLAEVQAALKTSQSDLDKLLAGAKEEEIKVAETAVENARIAVENAEKSLQNVEEDAEEDLSAAYEDALNTLDDAYIKIYNALNKVDLIHRDYFYRNDQEGINVRESKEKITAEKDRIKVFLEEANNHPTDDNIDTALAEMKESLRKVSSALNTIQEATDSPSYKYMVSTADKAALQTHRANINTALTNIVNDQQTISSTKITNKTNIDTARATLDTAKGTLKKAQDELSLLKAGPTQEEIELYKNKVKQAEASVASLQNQIQEATLRSPIAGKVTKVAKKVGETAQLTETVVSLISNDPLQIKVDIYEEDIVKVALGNLVDILIPAFPNEILQGEVISIDPAEKLVGGVVYYEVTIAFNEEKEGLRPGMTADVIIKTASKENVLIVPTGALKEKGGRVTVDVLEDGVIKEREIRIGLRGNDSEVEVLSGLEEGEIVIIQ